MICVCLFSECDLALLALGLLSLALSASVCLNVIFYIRQRPFSSTGSLPSCSLFKTEPHFLSFYKDNGKLQIKRLFFFFFTHTGANTCCVQDEDR